MAKMIVITGASTGIGAETARLLAEGNNIFIHYNSSREAAEQTAAEVQDRGGTAHLIQADLFGEAGCNALYSEVSVLTNRVDVLVNNAGGLIQRQPCSFNLTENHLQGAVRICLRLRVRDLRQA